MKCGFREKLVSVVMTAYNAEEYIREAIECILNQTYQNFEFIIIDDGSTDSTLDIVLEYAKKDNRIMLISRKNIGLAESLNDGVRIARGEYIARMDADDICDCTRFEKQVNYLNEHPEIYLLGTNYYIIYEDGISEQCAKKYRNAQKRGQDPIDRNNMFLSVSESQKFMHASGMLRREFYEIAGMYREYKAEDIEITFRALAKGLGVAKLEEELYGYRAREDSKSYQQSSENWSQGIIESKFEWLVNNLDTNFERVNYYIWGADISGKTAKEIIQNRFKESNCIGFIDLMKAGGEFEGKEVIHPDDIKDKSFDYVFICTQAGAVMARKTMKELGYKEICEYFKLS